MAAIKRHGGSGGVRAAHHARKRSLCALTQLRKGAKKRSTKSVERPPLLISVAASSMVGPGQRRLRVSGDPEGSVVSLDIVVILGDSPRCFAF
jgi:hypothetical protein